MAGLVLLVLSYDILWYKFCTTQTKVPMIHSSLAMFSGIRPPQHNLPPSHDHYSDHLGSLRGHVLVAPCEGGWRGGGGGSYVDSSPLLSKSVAFCLGVSDAAALAFSSFFWRSSARPYYILYSVSPYIYYVYIQLAGIFKKSLYLDLDMFPCMSDSKWSNLSIMGAQEL